jgi:decaprenylphospho-beta-D-ribofuranose 2-oxidase
MSVVELRPRVQRQAVERSLSGWGLTAHSRCSVTRARAADDVPEMLAAATRPGGGMIARGAGRSYGDAAQNAGGEVLDMAGLDRILWIDAERGLVAAQAGATIAQLMARLAAYGLTLPVVPGTRHVTLGGAIASDIHGKNHHNDGAFARHVVSLRVCTPAHGLLDVSPQSDPELFYGTLGGMGLTGVIVEATVRAERLSSPWVCEDVDRTDGLEQTLALMAQHERRRYSVAWLDLLAPGAKMGRAVVSRADPQPAGAPTPSSRGRRGAAGAYPGTLSRKPLAEVPSGFPGTLLRPSSIRAFNALRWRMSPRRERARPLAVAPYFFPLDVLGAWNRLYGAGGLIQYQFVVPAGEEAALQRCFELVRVRRLPVFLAVFKRFGGAFGGPLSFPMEGWTLAMDMPAAADGLEPALRELDEVVAGCGGRVYLSKDVRLRADTLRVMYPRLHEMDDLRARVDPEGVMRSDLASRLELCGAQR